MPHGLLGRSTWKSGIENQIHKFEFNLFRICAERTIPLQISVARWNKLGVATRPDRVLAEKHDGFGNSYGSLR